ncbi:MAG TPA: hypothetical protein PKN04_01120 [bacterium]|nr:hypothetical protein [bacterium]HNT64360.1 hypothetical protein [bacterium]HOX85350.1 hypothetical protein [bacterium]HPG44509.1 hypothetical protein [bacterium]HPM97067.1 hypothetical protein [bacterium]
MENRTPVSLPESLKFQILCRMLKGKRLSVLMEQLDDEQCLALQSFVWEKTLEFGIRAKGRRFSQEELLGQLKAAEARKSDIVYGFVFKGLSRFSLQNDSPALIRAKMQEQVDLMCRVANQFIEIQMSE